MDGVEQFVRKVAPKDGTYLRNFLGRAQPIQPRHQRIMQRRRDGVARIATFEQGARQLLDEQRHAAGALDDGRDRLMR
jgi:hypothetical protein